jgi:hypothetical protein
MLGGTDQYPSGGHPRIDNGEKLALRRTVSKRRSNRQEALHGSEHDTDLSLANGNGPVAWSLTSSVLELACSPC